MRPVASTACTSTPIVPAGPGGRASKRSASANRVAPGTMARTSPCAITRPTNSRFIGEEERSQAADRCAGGAAHSGSDHSGRRQWSERSDESRAQRHARRRDVTGDEVAWLLRLAWRPRHRWHGGCPARRAHHRQARRGIPGEQAGIIAARAGRNHGHGDVIAKSQRRDPAHWPIKRHQRCPQTRLDQHDLRREVVVAWRAGQLGENGGNRTRDDRKVLEPDAVQQPQRGDSQGARGEQPSRLAGDPGAIGTVGLHLLPPTSPPPMPESVGRYGHIAHGGLDCSRWRSTTARRCRGRISARFAWGPTLRGERRADKGASGPGLASLGGSSAGPGGLSCRRLPRRSGPASGGGLGLAG